MMGAIGEPVWYMWGVRKDFSPMRDRIDAVFDVLELVVVRLLLLMLLVVGAYTLVRGLP